MRNSSFLALSIDMDGILVDTGRYWLDALNAEVGTNYHQDDVKTWDFSTFPEEHVEKLFELLNRDHFMLGPPPVPGAVEAMKRIQKEEIPFCVLTTPTLDSKTMVWDKSQWLLKHFPFLGSPKKYAVYTGRKDLVMNPFSNHNILIDDSPRNMRRAINESSYVASFGLRYKYNEAVEEEDLRIMLFDNWEEMLSEIISENFWIDTRRAFEQQELLGDSDKK